MSPSETLPALPLEIWSNIFSFMDAATLLYSIVHVCRAWHHLGWREMKGLQWKRGGATSLMNIIDHMDRFSLTPYLRWLSLANPSPDDLLQLPRLPSLRGLSLKDVTPDSWASSARPASASGKHYCCCCGLWFLNHITGLESLVLDNVTYVLNLQCATTLQSLTRLELHNFTLLIDPNLQPLHSLTRLQSLTLHNCVLVTDDGLAHVAPLTQLRSLDISACLGVTGQGLRHLSGMRHLEHLGLNRCYQMDDNALTSVGKLSTLRSLALAFTEVTPNGLRALIPRLPLLKSLDLRSCLGLPHNLKNVRVSGRKRAWEETSTPVL